MHLPMAESHTAKVWSIQASLFQWIFMFETRRLSGSLSHNPAVHWIMHDWKASVPFVLALLHAI